MKETEALPRHTLLNLIEMIRLFYHKAHFSFLPKAQDNISATGAGWQLLLRGVDGNFERFGRSRQSHKGILFKLALSDHQY